MNPSCTKNMLLKRMNFEWRRRCWWLDNIENEPCSKSIKQVPLKQDTWRRKPLFLSTKNKERSIRSFVSTNIQNHPKNANKRDKNQRNKKKYEWWNQGLHWYCWTTNSTKENCHKYKNFRIENSQSKYKNQHITRLEMITEDKQSWSSNILPLNTLGRDRFNEKSYI